MSFACVNCAHIPGCRHARVAHVCETFEYTPLLNARETLVRMLGEPAAIRTLTKGKKIMAAPEHPNTSLVKDLVSRGDIDALQALKEDTSIPLPYLVMAASHLVGDSNKIGGMLRNAADKRGTLLDLLCDIARESANEPAFEAGAVETADEPDDAQDDDDVVEEAPKKRRKRRTKAEIEADSSSAAPAQDTALNVDFDRAFNDVLSAISEIGAQSSGDVKAISSQLGQLTDRVVRTQNALRALEAQLMMTGMILEPTISEALDEV
jgi:hypothetical protein